MTLVLVPYLNRSARTIEPGFISKGINPWTSDVRGKEVISVVALLAGKKCWRIKKARRIRRMHSVLWALLFAFRSTVFESPATRLLVRRLA